MADEEAPAGGEVEKLKADLKKAEALVKRRDKEIAELRADLEHRAEIHNERLAEMDRAHGAEIERLARLLDEALRGGPPADIPQGLEERLRAFGSRVKGWGPLHVVIHDGSVSDDALARARGDARGDAEALELLDALAVLPLDERAALRLAVKQG